MTAARRGAIVVFAKVPRPGRVKTRLTPPLSPEQAAELYSHFLDDVLATTAEIAEELDLEPVVTVHPPDSRREIAQRVRSKFRVVGQRGRDLAERMTWAALEAAAAGAAPILLRGSDSPALDGAIVRQALLALDAADLSICPDPDGGYSLIALRRPQPFLFDHAMSTDAVLDETLARASARGLRAALLPPSFDIDTVADLERLARIRERGILPPCPRTLTYLDREALWPARRSNPGDREPPPPAAQRGSTARSEPS